MTNNVYSALGFVTALRYQLGPNEFELTFDKQMSWTKSRKKAVYVMLARNNREILLVSWNPTKTSVPRGSHKQKRIVSSWSDWNVTNAWKIPTIRKKLKRSGKITRIEYTSDKFEREGDNQDKFHLYRHDFKKVVPFYMSTGEDLFKFTHPSLFNWRGIIA